MSEQRPRRDQTPANHGLALGDFHEQLRRAEFLQPKADLRWIGFSTFLKIMRLNQSPDHRPVLVALGFLWLHEVGQGEQSAACGAREFDGGASLPKCGE